MSVATLPQTLTIDEAVELCWERVFAGEFKNGQEAARSIWHDIRLSSETVEWLAFEGFIAHVRVSQSRITSAGRHHQPSVGWGSPHGHKFDRYIALTWPYESADGSQKALLDWNTDDLAALGAKAGEYVQRWSAKREWASETTDFLAEHSVDVIRKLPAHVLAVVNETALNVMGRDQS